MGSRPYVLICPACVACTALLESITVDMLSVEIALYPQVYQLVLHYPTLPLCCQHDDYMAIPATRALHTGWGKTHKIEYSRTLAAHPCSRRCGKCWSKQLADSQHEVWQALAEGRKSCKKAVQALQACENGRDDVQAAKDTVLILNGCHAVSPLHQQTACAAPALVIRFKADCGLSALACISTYW